MEVRQAETARKTLDQAPARAHSVVFSTSGPTVPIKRGVKDKLGSIAGVLEKDSGREVMERPHNVRFVRKEAV
ncbi:hypothetical protein M8818_002149 [Zalaria obscura]|uniref:Uncharacterized protein n=1 Tax=Zalaria obscura TaxID=2024903 RepID=A0ACC3SI07_9PEZI